MAKRGYESLLDYYQKVAPHLNPGYMPGQAYAELYTRPTWFTQSEDEGYSGVRGAPRRYSATGPPTRLAVVLYRFSDIIHCFVISFYSVSNVVKNLYVF